MPTKLNYQPVLREPRPGFGSPLDYEPRRRLAWVRRFLRTWSASLLSIAGLAIVLAAVYLLVVR